MKKLIIILLFTAFASFAQQLKFAWISDLHIGYPTALADLDSVVKHINRLGDLNFLVATGDITEKGLNEELENAKKSLDNLKIPYFIIPGNHDTKWSESGGIKFIELWDSDRFSFIRDSILFIGINSGIPWRGGGGHISPEDLKWFGEELKSDTYNNIYLFLHHPLDSETDNWFKLTNLIPKSIPSVIFVGHGHSNKILKFNGIPGAMCRSTLSKDAKSFGFNVVKRDSSKLEIIEYDSRLNKSWAEIDLNKIERRNFIDSLQFRNYLADDIREIDLKSTLSSEIITAGNKIISADYSGLISCFNQNGKLLWEYDTFGNIQAGLAATERYLLAGTLQGDIITLDLRNGDQIQSLGIDEAITSNLRIIPYSGRMNLVADENNNEAVIVATSSGSVYCYDVETLQELWRNNSAKGMIECSPLFINNKIVYGSWDSYLYCIDARDGILIWKWQDEKNFYYSPAASSPVSDGKNVFIASPNKNIYSIDLNLGTTVWKSDKYEAWESIALDKTNKILMVKSYKDYFYTVDAETGKLLMSIKINYGIDTNPLSSLDSGNEYILGGKNGFIYKINSGGVPENVMFLGTARINSLLQISENKFAASNMDGKIVLFSLSKN